MNLNKEVSFLLCFMYFLNKHKESLYPTMPCVAMKGFLVSLEQTRILHVYIKAAVAVPDVWCSFKTWNQCINIWISACYSSNNFDFAIFCCLLLYWLPSLVPLLRASTNSDSELWCWEGEEGLAARVITRLIRALLPSQMFLRCSPCFASGTCADMCSWGILSLGNDPISLSGGTGWWWESWRRKVG